MLAEARALWRGEAFAEFPDVGPLTGGAVTASELRRNINEAFLNVLLDLGDNEQAVEAASEHLAGEPSSEPTALALMRALHALGRTSDALRTGYQYRRRLTAETGIDPTPALGDLEAELAAVAALPSGMVPRSPHRLRGRDAELAALRRLLASERLVTVVGPGGVGKTRLAVEAAAGFEPATAVLLSSITDDRALPQAIADALGLRVLRGDALNASAALLAAGPRLLLLDTCEHLLAGVRHAVEVLTLRCPELTVLATSREPLGLAVEQRLRLAPLSVAAPADLDSIEGSPAVAVFVDRAMRLKPDSALGPEQLVVVTDIVRRLDGLPLAIELAAARLSALGLEDLRARLDHALDLLGDDREGTLRQAVRWSYDLLPDDEQRLLRHISVFPDGLELAAAEAIALDLALGRSALAALGHLVDSSMLEMSLSPITRYRMLDTVRAFALEELAKRGETKRATERFLSWALDLAGWIAETTYGPDEGRVDGALRRELANLRAAWVLLRSQDRTHDAFTMVTALLDAAFWRDMTEVWDWSLELAADFEAKHRPEGPEMLGLAATSAWFRGELDKADELATAGLELAADEWSCLDAKSLVALSRGDLDAATTYAAAAGDTARRPVQSYGIAALASAYRGDLDAARTLNDRFRAHAASRTLEAFHTYITGEIEALTGNRDDALWCYEAAIDRAQSVGSTFVQGIASVGRLSQLAATGQTDRALAGYRELIDYWERTGSWVQQWTTLRNLADILDSLGDSEPAFFLRAAAACAPDAPPVPDVHQPPPRAVDAETIDRLRTDAGTSSRIRILQVARDAIESALDR
jgi:predicted ATPase